MIGNVLLELFDWISSFFSKLNSLMITSNVSLLTLIICCSIINMLIVSLISRGHE